MQDTSVESKICELSAKVDSLVWGYKFGAWIILFLFSLVNIADTFAISYFRNLYREALPGMPLPWLTALFIDHQFVATLFAILWPIIGLIEVKRSKKITTTITVIFSLLIIVFLQITLNWWGLFIPLLSIGTGISDAR